MDVRELRSALRAWEVGTYERGMRPPLARHRDEATACADLLRRLT
ncbi:hypothetical protein [Streptomyces alboniger]|nr:hypothetical protein [Streptomyces alboniger]